MKKITLGLAAVTLLAAFVAGCATPPPPEPAPTIIRKG